jgi:hypothetical protein
MGGLFSCVKHGLNALNASDKIACKLDLGLKIEIELSFYLVLSEITQLKNWATLTISGKNQEMSVFLGSVDVSPQP